MAASPNNLRRAVALAACLGAAAAQAASKPSVRVTLALHAQSVVSDDNKTSLEALASLAGRRGVDALAPADYLVQRWSYGLPPFPGLLRRTLSRSSVLRFGPRAYLAIHEKLRREHPDLLLLPGVEAAPSYGWTGHPARGDLALRGAQRHMMIVGLGDADAIAALPVKSNPRAGAVRWSSLLVPAALVLAGLALMTRWPAGLLIVTLGLLGAADQRPLRRLPAATEDFAANGYAAAGALAARAAVRGARTGWAHPDDPGRAAPQRFSYHVPSQTDPYPEALREAPAVNGFEYFPAGTRTGAPGGEWDLASADYLAGKRAAPAWAFAGADEGAATDSLFRLRNVAWCAERTERALLDALRAGRFYAVSLEPGHGVSLDRWELSAGTATAVSGESAAWRPGAALRVEVRSTEPAPARHILYVTIVKGGEVWKQFRASGTWSAAVPVPAPAGGDFYRLDVREEGGAALVSNPIFSRAAAPETPPR